MHRTPAGLLLERLLSHLKDSLGYNTRHLFCYNGESPDDSYDCACCITWPDDELYSKCGCICHVRIEAMANTSDLNLLFTTLRLQDMLPDFPKSLEEFQTLKAQQERVQASAKKAVEDLKSPVPMPNDWKPGGCCS